MNKPISQNPPAPSQSDHRPNDERRRSNLVRNSTTGRIVKNDRKQAHKVSEGEADGR